MSLQDRISPSGVFADADDHPFRDVAGYTFEATEEGTSDDDYGFALLLDDAASGNLGTAVLPVQSVGPAPSSFSEGTWVADVELAMRFSSTSAAATPFTAGALEAVVEFLDDEDNPIAAAPRVMTEPWTAAARDNDGTTDLRIGQQATARVSVPVSLPEKAASARVIVSRIEVLPNHSFPDGTDAGVLLIEPFTSTYTIRKVG